MILYTDGQAFENKKPKESYIAVVAEVHEHNCLRNDETLISFIHVGDKMAHEAEGIALLQAVRYIEKHRLFFSSIYTDSLVWANALNGVMSFKGNKDHQVSARKVSELILELKKRYYVGITWRSRKVNKAGIFLAHVWSLKDEEREKLLMLEKKMIGKI